MLLEDFHEIELPVQENGKWIVYAAGSKTIRLLSDAKLHEDETFTEVLSADGVTYVPYATCEFDTEFDATACGLTYLLEAMLDEKERIEAEALMNDELEDDDSAVMDFE